MASESSGNKGSVGQRIKAELIEYAFISLYLWICFGALEYYRTAVLLEESVQTLPIGIALVKALILGKFILIGKAMKVGSRLKPGTLLNRIVWKSLLFLLLLLIFKVIEELIVGLVHGQTVAAIFTEFTTRSWLEYVAPSMVMLLILIPMISFEEFDHALGKGTLRRLLFDPGQ